MRHATRLVALLRHLHPAAPIVAARARVACARGVCACRVRVPCARAVCACRVRVSCACAVCACCAQREELLKSVPQTAIQRRQARVSADARRRLRVSALTVIAARRLSGDPDALRAALQAGPITSAPDGGTPTIRQSDVLVVPPSQSALQALNALESEASRGSEWRRGSEASMASYKSDDMRARVI